MSLDISVKFEGIELDFNTFRSPYGLIDWSEDNIGDNFKDKLWFVCTEWTYEKAKDIDKVLFLSVISNYYNKIKKLEKGYYFFDLPSFIQLVIPYYDKFPKMQGCYCIECIPKDSFYSKKNELAIPMQYFGFTDFDNSLDFYKNWFKRLYDIAILLQNDKAEFCCSN